MSASALSQSNCLSLTLSNTDLKHFAGMQNKQHLKDNTGKTLQQLT